MKIENKDDYEYALLEVEFLMEEIDRLERNLDEFSKAVEEYEDVHYPIEKPSLWDKIKFRLYQWF